MSGGSLVPPAPYDLLPPAQRDWFERYGEGLVVLLPAQRPGPGGWGRGGPPHGGAWVHVGADGKVRAFIGKVEVGQGTSTALSLLVAEEVGVPLTAVELTMGDTDLCPWDMGTFGSRSMPDAGENLRRTGAAARAVLLGLASAKLDVPVAQLRATGGRVEAGDGRSVGYPDLVRGLRRVETATPDASPTPAATWTTAGHPVVDTRAGLEIVTGRRRYTSDLHLPGMLYGRLLFPPTYGARLKRVDTSRAESLPGVTVLHEGDLVAVAAPDMMAASAALRSIQAEWESSPQPSERTIAEYLRTHPEEGEDSWDVVHHQLGDVAKALASAPVHLKATYSTAYIAHVPLETHAVIASWEGARVTVHVGSQTPFRVRDAVADALEISPAHVRVIVPPTGSGFGGKHSGELVAAAAKLARAAGHPVRIALTREEEFTHAYFRPMAVIEAEAGAGRDGGLTAWQFHVLNAGAAAARTPYDVPNQKVDTQPCASPLPQGSYRALAATANNFARESLMDEMASRLGADPLTFRLHHLKEERLAAVLTAVAEHVGWSGRARSPGHGFGVAAGLEKGGRIATFAEVRVHDGGRLEVVRLVSGFECGAIVHPDNLRNQVQGAAVQALGGALFEAIHFDGGRILNPHLSDYRVPRFRDVPAIEVLLVDRRDLPSQGGGETPLIAVAPALANAIFDATGKRLRSLPLAPEGIVVGSRGPEGGPAPTDPATRR